jgi:hypothetical protein
MTTATVVTLCTLYTFAQHTSNIVAVVLFVKLYSPANIDCMYYDKFCMSICLHNSLSLQIKNLWKVP